MDTKALREQRAKLLADARAVIEKAEAESRPLTSEEREQVAKMDADIDAIRGTIEARERILAESAYVVPESQRQERAREEAHGDERQVAYRNAFDAYLRHGFLNLNAEQRDTLRNGFNPLETREQNLTGANGGYTVAPNTSFYGQLQEARKFFGGMFQAGCTVLRTATGAALPIPTNNDTANVGAIVAEEGSHASGTALTLAQVSLGAYLYSSKIVKVSWQLLQDSEIDFPALLARKFGERLGRIQNTHLTTGDASSKPQGVVTGAASGVAAATGNTTSIPADNLFDLFHSVDIAYRANGKWMMSDTAALTLRKLKDGNGQYLWQAGLQAGSPDMLLGKPVVINNDVAVPATSAKSILFGDFSSYYIREVRDVTVVRLDELYAANGQVGFMAFMRMDGAMVDAGTNPVKYFAHSAS